MCEISLENILLVNFYSFYMSYPLVIMIPEEQISVSYLLVILIPEVQISQIELLSFELL